MYQPTHFTETDCTALAALVHAHNFATLISTIDRRPFASHLPFVFDETRGVLLAHMARGNPHWQALASQDEEVLVVFQGPHCYVSPSWYEKAGVPTWNYTAVHIYGRYTQIDDEARHREILQRLTEQHEQDRETPWVADFGSELVQTMFPATVAFEISVDEIQGKFKLSQNRSAIDQARVIAELEAGDDNSRGIADLMRKR